MRIERFWTFTTVLIGIPLIGCSSTPSTDTSITKPAYVLPSKITLDFSVKRGVNGAIFVVGATNLPDGTKLGAEITEPSGAEAQDYEIHVTDGKFRSEAFSDRGRPIPPGKRKVHMFTYFNGAWQSPEILRIVGDGGVKLTGKPIKLQDPDVTDSDKLVDLTRLINIPLATDGSSEQDALDCVKHAVLTVDGRQSATDIETNIDLFMRSPGLKTAKGWSIKNSNTGRSIVSYDFIDGDNGEQQAVWEFDHSTQKVRYLNKRAKLMSWTPAD